MPRPELEKLSDEILEFQNALEHGVDTLDQEQNILWTLIDLKERFAAQSGNADDPDLPALRQRLADVEQEIDDDCHECEQWAENVEIEAFSIEPDIEDRAGRKYGTPFGENGLVAYCRHNCTNYDSLLAEAAEQFSDTTAGYAVIRTRVDRAVVKALERIGINCWDIQVGS